MCQAAIAKPLLAAGLLTNHKRMTTVIAILLIALVAEIQFSPRLGFTRENKILLWYGKRNRKYIMLL